MELALPYGVDDEVPCETLFDLVVAVLSMFILSFIVVLLFFPVSFVLFVIFDIYFRGFFKRE
jgi:hypothetical protein